MNLNELKKLIKTNPLNKGAFGSPTVDLQRFFGSLSFYKERFEGENPLDSTKLIEAMTPEFQRSNTKWSKAQQTAFIQNVISGFRPELSLYFIDGDLSDNCYILDGLQRIGSISLFTQNKLEVFGDYRYGDLLGKIKLSPSSIQLKIYKFASHEQACDHYIQINRFMTHSEEDLMPAYAFLAKENDNASV